MLIIMEYHSDEFQYNFQSSRYSRFRVILRKVLKICLTVLSLGRLHDCNHLHCVLFIQAI